MGAFFWLVDEAIDVLLYIMLMLREAILPFSLCRLFQDT